MDCFSLQVLVQELRPRILGRSVQRVKSLGDRMLEFGLRSSDTAYLVLSILPSFPAIFLNDQDLPSEGQSSDALMALRKYLLGGRITRVSKHLAERVVLLQIENYRLSDRAETYAMTLELIPNRVKVCLLGPQEEMLVSLPPEQPAGLYRRQGPKAAAPLDSLNRDRFVRLFQGSREVSQLARALGLSPAFAGEIVHRASGGPEAAWQALQSLMKTIEGGPHSPRIYYPLSSHEIETKTARNMKAVVSPIPLASLEGTREELFPRMNDLYAELFRRYLRHDARLRATQSRLSSITGALKKKVRLRENLLADLRKSQAAEVFKIYADLLYAQQHKSPKGLASVRVANLFDSNLSELDIPLEPTLSVVQNANRYSRLYQKANRALPQIQERLRKLDHDIESLQAERRTLTDSVSSTSLLPAEVPAESEIHVAPGESGIPKGPSRRKGTLAAPSARWAAAAPETMERKNAKIFVSSEGLQILVGKSSRDNDVLTLRIARSEDFWLHAAGYGGSHVVLRNPEKLAAAPRQSLLEAAQLAAYFSQARNAPKVEVHYTQKKFVSKPKGAKPGLVRLKEYKSVSVRPKLLEVPEVFG